jgi:hypothetical protein
MLYTSVYTIPVSTNVMAWYRTIKKCTKPERRRTMTAPRRLYTDLWLAMRDLWTALTGICRYIIGLNKFNNQHWWRVYEFLNYVTYQLTLLVLYNRYLGSIITEKERERERERENVVYWCERYLLTTALGREVKYISFYYNKDAINSIHASDFDVLPAFAVKQQKG